MRAIGKKNWNGKACIDNSCQQNNNLDGNKTEIVFMMKAHSHFEKAVPFLSTAQKHPSAAPESPLSYH